MSLATTPARLRLRWHIAVALAAGALLRLFFVWRYSYVIGDSLLYGDLAINLLRHGRYGFSDTVRGLQTVRPTLIRLPGYPLFLAACFSLFGVGRYTAVLLVQVAFDLWTCLLLRGIARRLWASERAGMAALWLGALCPFMATYTAASLTEVLTLWTIALAFYALMRWHEDGRGLNRWAYALAFALSYSILLRPDEGLLAAAVIPALAWMGRDKSKIVLAPGGRHFVRSWTLRVVRVPLMVSLLTLLPLVPWTLRNERTFRTFQPLAPKNANDPGERVPIGFERWYRTWAIDFASTEQVYWNWNSDQVSIADLPNRAFDSDEQYDTTAALLAEYNENTTPTPQLDARFDALARERIHADLMRYYVALPAARMLNMLLRPRADMLPWPLDWWSFRMHPGATLGMSLFALLNLAYLALAVLGLNRRAAWRPWAPVVGSMLAMLALRTALLLTIDNSETRYTLEFYPVLIAFAAGVVTTKASASPSRNYAGE